MNKKMLMLMAGGKGEKGRRVGVEYEDWGVKDNYPMIEPYSGGYGPYRMNYPMEDKFRDRRGREHYDDGRYAPRSMMEPEDRGYRRYSDGRFAPRSDYSDPWMDHRRNPTTFDEGEHRMNPIGFARDGSDATMPQYHEMERMEGSGMSRGYQDILKDLCGTLASESGGGVESLGTVEPQGIAAVALFLRDGRVAVLRGGDAPQPAQRADSPLCEGGADL